MLELYTRYDDEISKGSHARAERVCALRNELLSTANACEFIPASIQNWNDYAKVFFLKADLLRGHDDDLLSQTVPCYLRMRRLLSNTNATALLQSQALASFAMNFHEHLRNTHRSENLMERAISNALFYRKQNGGEEHNLSRLLRRDHLDGFLKLLVDRD